MVTKREKCLVNLPTDYCPIIEKTMRYAYNEPTLSEVCLQWSDAEWDMLTMRRRWVRYAYNEPTLIETMLTMSWPWVRQYLCWANAKWNSTKNEQTLSKTTDASELWWANTEWDSTYDEPHWDGLAAVNRTATQISLMYSFSGNSAASAPISTFMCLWAIYIVPGTVYIFPPAE